MSLKDKVVIITGASSGIGAATTKKLVENGAKVVIGARREERLKSLADQFEEGSVIYQKTDVSNLEDMKSLAQLALDKFGKIDAIYNNAGVMPTASLNEYHHDEWQRMVNINIMGVLNGIEAVLPTMEKQGSGHILATSSVAGHVVYPGSAVYCGTKFAVRAIMEGLRQEEGSKGIKSTIISPGAVDTELYKSISDEKAQEDLIESWKQPNMALRAEDIADGVIYALDSADHTSVSEVLIRPTAQEI
ncbi:SDR family oxidoreductase [Companilactobacillus kedongensis]|uniref:SDR family oxidoreductase n=1 Tax=Companilactobacillus kedongensis TaxID=2486004 RepID=UPI000F7B269B|nr:SDR family oxidoreductase [Companilactobacillus kedongensis]